MPQLIVRFVADSSFTSRAIRWVTFADFSHVEIGWPNGGWIGAHAAGGVQVKPVDWMTPSLERVYALEVTQDQYDAAMDYGKSMLGTRYSFTDIIGILFRIRFSQSPHGAICSWFGINLMEATSIYPLNVLGKCNFKITPTMLHLSPVFIGRCVRESARPI